MNSTNYKRETEENENNSCFESDIQHSNMGNLDFYCTNYNTETERNEKNSCFESDIQHSNK